MRRPTLSIFEKNTIEILRSSLEELEKGFSKLPPSVTHIKNKRAFEKVIREVTKRLKDNYPYFHPLYAGQMLKPPHPIARIAYMLSMWINPNNHALDGGRASSAMEKEAVAEISKMFGWKSHVGHLTGGGTMANLEALWIAGQLSPGKKIVASEQAHYTHSRISTVLGLKFESVPCNIAGKMDIEALKKLLDTGNVGTVVATIGTTAIGSVDPLPQILELRKQYGFRLHADAAYGGYFILVDNLDPETKKSFEKLCEVDSIVVDPHKHGLQPYGCGCVIFRDPTVARFYKHDSPYTYFTSDELHLGEISLECSRAGASAVALWATQKLLPLVKNGEFAKMLSGGREAALALYQKLLADNRFVTPFQPALDIVVWAPVAKKVSEASKLSQAIFDEAAKRNLHLALAELPVEFFGSQFEKDRETVTCLRSVLMKPEHLNWLERIWKIINATANIVMVDGKELKAK
ncbi:MAG: aminotransferase class V-fold PLP-dependent enzyme [Candidatus Kryptoniota bacterium]